MLVLQFSEAHLIIFLARIHSFSTRRSSAVNRTGTRNTLKYTSLEAKTPISLR